MQLKALLKALNARLAQHSPQRFHRAFEPWASVEVVVIVGSGFSVQGARLWCRDCADVHAQEPRAAQVLVLDRHLQRAHAVGSDCVHRCSMLHEELRCGPAASHCCVVQRGPA